MHVRLVEDDVRFAAVLSGSLRRCGYDVDHVSTAAGALEAASCDLVLLDLGLPDGDGIDVCRRLRARGGVPIIVLSARQEERDRVLSLRCGADDYLVKPFGFAELQARIEAVLRRARPTPVGVRCVGRLRIDLDSRHTYIGTEPITLTRKEFDLLAVLTEQAGTTVRRERLFTEVWHTRWPGTSRTLDVHMATLRAKTIDGAQIQTVRGVGYRLVPVAAGA